MDGTRYRAGNRRDFLARVVLLLLGLIAFLPVLGNGLLNWDDPIYVTSSSALQGPHPLASIWSGSGTPQYYPLSWTLLWAEHRLWGDLAAGYHAVSLALHLLCGLVLYGLLRRFVGIVPAAAGAALFLVHPIQVATVAWAAEQKTHVGSLVVLLSLRWWIDAERARGRALSAGLYMLSLLGKTSVLATPLVFPLVRGLRTGRGRTARPWAFAFAVPALAAAFVTAHQEKAPFREEGYAVLDRVFLAARGFWFYVGKVLLPAGLSALYPKWERTGAVPEAWIALAAVASLAVALVLLHRRGSHGVVAGIALFVLPLAPASGLVRFGYLEKAFVGDHLLYLSMAGVALLAAIGVERLQETLSATSAGRPPGGHPNRWPARVVLTGAVVVISVLGVMSCVRTRLYRNSRTFWEAVLVTNPGSEIAHNNLGVALLDARDRALALAHFREASRLRPSYYEARINQATVFLAVGDTTAARSQLREALRNVPGDRAASERLRLLGGETGDTLAATERRLRADLAADSTGAERVLALARFLTAEGRSAEAIPLLVAATRQDPKDARLRFELGSAYAVSGKLALAEQAYREVVRLRPDFADAHHNLGVVLRGHGKFDEAVRELMEALRLSPNDPDTQRNLELARQRIP
jgi:tetratricopeptide (TPR) repeat protein